MEQVKIGKGVDTRVFVRHLDDGGFTESRGLLIGDFALLGVQSGLKVDFEAADDMVRSLEF